MIRIRWCGEEYLYCPIDFGLYEREEESGEYKQIGIVPLTRIKELEKI